MGVCPDGLQREGWQRSALQVPVRHGPSERERGRGLGGEDPVVLVTFGCRFHRSELLERTVDGAAATGAAATGARIVAATGILPMWHAYEKGPRLRFEAFRPLAELLPAVDAVVSDGGPARSERAQPGPSDGAYSPKEPITCFTPSLSVLQEPGSSFAIQRR